MMLRSKIICLTAYGLVSSCLCFAQYSYAAELPTIELPPAASKFAVGEQFISNGMPMRVQGFVVKDMSLSQAAHWFKRSMGQPLVENKLSDKLILGRAQGGRYLTIQIEPISHGKPSGVKGLAAVSDIAAFNANRNSYINTVQRWRDRWPAGTQEVSRMTSQDGDKTAVHVAMRNTHGEQLNRNALVDMLRQDGLFLEREVSVNTSSPKKNLQRIQSGQTLYFKGAAKEAIATIVRTEQGKTDVLLNTTYIIEQQKK
jgi:hypothetical protein